MRRYVIEVFDPNKEEWEFFAVVSAESREAASIKAKKHVMKNRIYRVKGVQSV